MYAEVATYRSVTSCEGGLGSRVALMTKCLASMLAVRSRYSLCRCDEVVMEAEGTQGARNASTAFGHCRRVTSITIGQSALALVQYTDGLKGDSDDLPEYIHVFLEAWGAVHLSLSREHQDGDLWHYSPSIAGKLGALATQLFLPLRFQQLPLSPSAYTQRRGELRSCACMPALAFLRRRSTSSANI